MHQSITVFQDVECLAFIIMCDLIFQTAKYFDKRIQLHCLSYLLISLIFVPILERFGYGAVSQVLNEFVMELLLHAFESEWGWALVIVSEFFLKLLDWVIEGFFPLWLWRCKPMVALVFALVDLLLSLEVFNSYYLWANHPDYIPFDFNLANIIK